MLADIIFSAFLIVLSIIWIGEGLRLGLWIPGVSADSGFVPTVFATLTLVTSLYVIIKALRNRNVSAAKAADTEPEEKEEDQKENPLRIAIPVFFCIGAIFCLDYFGLVITVVAISFLWMYFVSKLGLKKSLIFTVAVTLFVYLVFEFWLKIPFPGKIIRL